MATSSTNLKLFILCAPCYFRMSLSTFVLIYVTVALMILHFLTKNISENEFINYMFSNISWQRFCSININASYTYMCFVKSLKAAYKRRSMQQGCTFASFMNVSRWRRSYSADGVNGAEVRYENKIRRRQSPQWGGICQPPHLSSRVQNICKYRSHLAIVYRNLKCANDYWARRKIY